MILEVWNRFKPLDDSDQNTREGTIHASVGSVPFSATPLLQYFGSADFSGGLTEDVRSIVLPV